MVLTWTLFWQPDDVIRRAWRTQLGDLPGLDRGALGLIAAEMCKETVDHKAVGHFSGLIFNDETAGIPLVGRGAVLQDHGDLALHAVGWGGPQGLAGLRWHGALAVVHVAQRSFVVARDWQGVGGLYFAQLGNAYAFSTDPQQLRKLDMQPRLVPAGMLALGGPQGLTWQPVPALPEHRGFFRDLPDDFPHQPAPAHVVERIRAALDACKRAGLQVTRSSAHDRAGQWLEQQIPLMQPQNPNALWTLDGADAWLGLDLHPPLDLQPGPWPQPEPAEPLRVPEPEARSRRLRATWLADEVLEKARQLARDRNLLLIAPHLDPLVLAFLGAMKPAQRPLA